MKIKSQNKHYEYLGFEEEVAQKFKEVKPNNKTNTEYLEELMSVASYYLKLNS